MLLRSDAPKALWMTWKGEKETETEKENANLPNMWYLLMDRRFRKYNRIIENNQKKIRNVYSDTEIRSDCSNAASTVSHSHINIKHILYFWIRMNHVRLFERFRKNKSETDQNRTELNAHETNRPSCEAIPYWVTFEIDATFFCVLLHWIKCSVCSLNDFYFFSFFFSILPKIPWQDCIWRVLKI